MSGVAQCRYGTASFSLQLKRHMLDSVLAPLAASGGEFLYILDGENKFWRNARDLGDVYKACHIPLDNPQLIRGARFVITFRGGKPKDFTRPDLDDDSWHNMRDLATRHSHVLKVFVCFDEKRYFDPQSVGKKTKCFDGSGGKSAHEHCSIDDAMVVCTTMWACYNFNRIGIFSGDVSMFTDFNSFFGKRMHTEFSVCDVGTG